jgi:SAM-dependent methyltransferase
MQQVDARQGGYLTDVAYVRQFCKELAPALLRAACALNGFAPPPSDDFDYCELGCGTGDTTNTLAAAHPRGRFVGVDFNSEHVAFARGLAERGALANVRFLERDFVRLEPDATPALDYVCAHGVLSWIAPATRAALIDFAAARLKPGGLLYVSYNALPGWAAVEPLRRLLRDASETVAGTSVERARHALAAARLLHDAGAEYFASNPAAKEMLATALQAGPTYAAHEYLGGEWHPMYFADVATEMSARGLRFVGQLPLYLNYRDVTIPATAADVFRGLEDRFAFERLKDFAVNEFFRGDVYMKGGPPRDGATARAYLDETSFGTLVPATGVKREVHLRHHVLRYDGDLFDALFARLAERRCTVTELGSDRGLAPWGADAIRDAVLRLLLGEQVMPMRTADDPVPTLYNRAILEQRLSTGSPVVLASPRAGTGIVVSTLHAVALRLLTSVDPAGWDAWIRAFVDRQPLRLHAGDRAVTDRSEQARILAGEVDKFRVARLPKLVALGAVDPVSSPVSGPPPSPRS